MTRTVATVLADLTAPGGAYELVTGDVDGRATPVYRNAPATMRDAFLGARRHRSTVALVGGGERWTYDELVRASCGLAASWRAAGVAPGDPVAIAAANGVPWVVSFWATLVAGAVAVPLNSWHTGPELAEALTDAGATLLCCDGARYERIAPHLDRLTGVRDVIVWDGPGNGDVSDGAGHGDGDGAAAHRLGRPWPSREKLLAGPGEPPAGFDRTSDDVATLLSTSGTSGRPKLAVATHRAHVTQLLNTALYYEAAATAAREAGFSPAPPVPLVAFPLFHVAGLINLYAATAMGGTVVLMSRWDPDEAAALVARERVTSTAMVPTMLRQLLAVAAAGGHDLSSLASLISGGAPAPAALIRSLTVAFPAASTATGYGLTETTGSATSIGGPEHLAHPDSVGRPFPSVLVRMVDPDSGLEVADGEVGEVRLSGATLARGYWNRPEETAETFVDGWLHTGDLGVREPGTGLLRLVDRRKDMIIRGGENVYCAEVEACLHEHPDVGDVAVLGLPDETYGEVVAAVVVARPGGDLTPERVREHASARLASFKVPSVVVFDTAPLPRNAVGKVLKRELRERLTAKADRRD